MKKYKPVADLGIISLDGAKTIAENIESYIKKWRSSENNFLIGSETPRFQSGEGKAHLLSSIRGKDLYIIVDVTNHSIEYDMYGEKTKMSPDDHYQDLKRIISAIGGKAHRITIIMPFLYEGRQHKRSSRESLDCSVMLRELENMGVDTIITFDAHDPRVQNAICLSNFENVSPMFQFVKSLVENVPDLVLDSEHLMVVSPDEGATQRGIFLSSVLGVNMGMCYKRRDFTKVVNGKNPIISHEFLGDSVEGKDILIIDDMIASGDSMLDVARQMKERGAKRVIAISTFGLFTSGLSAFDKAYEEGIVSYVLSTNLIYQTSDLLIRPYYINVQMESYLAALIDNLNCDNSISELINPATKIKEYLQNKENE
jgi:ribose-phosphate pyrophosphokinase